MEFENTVTSYSSISKLLHWLVFLFVLGLLFVGFFMGTIQNKELFASIINMHKLTGLAVLCLMIFRAFWAYKHPKPAAPFGTPLWQRFAERAVHFSLYAVLIAMPITGWIMAVASGHTPHLLSWTLSLPIPESKTLSETFFTVHNTLAFVIIGLVSIHVLAALYHYFVKKDNVLKRMMPGSSY